jgi:hypothetical protein
MSIERQLIGRYTDLVSKAQTLPEMMAAQEHLTTAIQDGTLQPYAGIPLVQSLTGSIKQKQAEAQSQMLQQYAPQVVPQQQGQAPAPIASQVMAQAAGLDNLRSNLPAEEGYAQGGVIAFAGPSGSLVGDDEEDDDENDYGSLSKQEEALLAQYMAGIEEAPEMPQGEMPQGREPQRGIASMGVQASPVGIDETKKGASEGIQYTAKKHKYETEIRNAARKAGISEDLFLHMMAKETGGLSNPEAARSKAGALGIAQFMPATAKQYGIDPMDINQALPAAAKMTASLLKKYDGNERLAAMAYNWGQGNVDKWLATGADPAKLPKETAGYIRAAEGGIMRLAAGGTVAFKKGGEPEEETDSQTAKDREDFILGAKKLGSAAADVVTLPARGVMGALNTGIRGVRAAGLNVPYIPEEAFGGSSSSLTPYYDRYIRANEPKPQAPVTTTPAPATSQFNVQPSAYETGPSRAELGLPEVDLRTTEEKDADEIKAEMKAFKESLNERATSAKQQKEIDAYMSILQAGLGMMGGTSPYAFANIGQGGMHGVNTAMAARKSQIAEENAILSGRLGLSRAELLERSRQNALDRQIKNDILLGKHREQQNVIAQQKVGVQAQANLINARKEYVAEGGPEKLTKEFTERYGKNWNLDLRYQKLFQSIEDQKIAEMLKVVAANEGIPNSTDLR